MARPQPVRQTSIPFRGAAHLKPPSLHDWEEFYLSHLVARGTGVGFESYPRPKAGGHTLALRLTPPSPLRGRIVVAHGTGNDLFFPQLGIFDVCLSLGFEVFAFDLDGHGRHSTTVLSEEGARSMIPAAIHAAHAGHGHEEPVNPLSLHGLGISLGGSLWLHAASRDKDPHLRSLTLLTTPLALSLGPAALATEALAVLRPEFWRLRHRYGGIRGAIPAFGPYRRDHFPLRLGSFPSLDTHASTPSYPKAVGSLIRVLAQEMDLRRISAPTLIVHGTRDLLVPRVNAERLAAELPRPQMVLVPQTTHFTTPFASRTEASIRDFLRGL